MVLLRSYEIPLQAMDAHFELAQSKYEHSTSTIANSTVNANMETQPLVDAYSPDLFQYENDF